MPYESWLEHYGMPRRSGRYPYGSGEHPYQHSGHFLSEIDRMKREEGMSEKDIADFLGLSTTNFRIQKQLASAEERSWKLATVKALQKDGMSNGEIAKQMGLKGESSVRNLLNEDTQARKEVSIETAEFLKKQIEEKGALDVGSTVEAQLRVSREKLNTAIYILELEGYPTHKIFVPQTTNPGRYTTQLVVCPKGMKKKELLNDLSKIHTITDYTSQDDGKTFKKSFVYPESLDSKRLQINYAEDGGIKKDGVIELRRGVEDLSLGESRYAQVRILVDRTHYLKGMAVYSDDLPPGVDVRFNTNKHRGTPVTGPKDNSVLKPISNDPDNPFGSLIKENGGQYYYKDKSGKEHLGLINKRADEGDWGDWKDKLSSQFLAKQSKELIKQQLDLEVLDKRTEFEELKAITNPTVKKARLETFASDCDSAAVHLKAAALPRQRYRVFLPMTSIKDNEIYAPQFKDGETLAIVRFPHGGTFEIPVLKNNLKNREGRKVITPLAKDAVGINSKVAEQLSGADFDGDAGMIIPCNSPFSKTRINARSPLKELEGYDPKVSYPKRPGMAILSKDATQKEMGIISNLITDMTIKGAKDNEIAKAVKHSMTVIDANKHQLDYKRSEAENQIDSLKKKWQSRGIDEIGIERYGGASTLLSKAKSKEIVPKRKGNPIINPDGSLSYKEANEYYITKESNIKFKKKAAETYSKEVESLESKYNKAKDSKSNMTISDSEYKAIQAGALQPNFLAAIKYRTDDSQLKPRSPKDKEIIITEKQNLRTQNSTKMSEVKDAYNLSSGSLKESLYADFANTMKSMANEARREMINTGNLQYSRSAANIYANEVASLNEKLRISQLNVGKERAAQRLASIRVDAKLHADESLYKDKPMLKKIKQQETTKAREEVGASRSASAITFTDKEWEAVQAGAISENKLKQMLKYADTDDLVKRSTPRDLKGLRPAQVSRLKAMASRGFAISEIADALGISVSSVEKYL